MAALMAFITLITLVVLTPPAQANSFGWSVLHPSGCCMHADNKSHSYNYSSLTGNMKVAGNYAMINLGSQTDMTVHYDSTPNNQTDVEMFDQYYDDYWGIDRDGSSTGTNVHARAQCVRALVPAISTSWWKCDQYEVRFDLADMNRFSENERKHTACHEVGHTVGLGHSSQTSSCLRDGRVSTRTYNSHDIAHINGRY